MDCWSDGHLDPGFWILDSGCGEPGDFCERPDTTKRKRRQPNTTIFENFGQSCVPRPDKRRQNVTLRRGALFLLSRATGCMDGPTRLWRAGKDDPPPPDSASLLRQRAVWTTRQALEGRQVFEILENVMSLGGAENRGRGRERTSR